MMATKMGASGGNRDVAVILFSGHGEMIDNKYYLIPYGVDVATNTKMEATSLWVEEFADKVKHLAERGKVLLLLDACHSGAVGPSGSSPILDASALRNAVNMDNVTVLTSSQNKDELSYESPTVPIRLRQTPTTYRDAGAILPAAPSARSDRPLKQVSNASARPDA